MLIGFDIDGVLFDWEGAANATVVERFGITDPGPHVAWDYLKGVLTSLQWRWLWSRDGQDAVFSRLSSSHADGIYAVNALTRAGHDVHFVTHRDPRYTAGHTAAFLSRHVGRHPWAGLHVVRNSVRKAGLMPWAVFVDDKPETVWDLLDHRATTHVFAPARPWNIDELGDVDTPRLNVYEDAWDIVEWVEART